MGAKIDDVAVSFSFIKLYFIVIIILVIVTIIIIIIIIIISSSITIIIIIITVIVIIIIYHGSIAPLYTAISRKVVGKSARDNPERYCGWPFEFTVERMAQEAMDARLLKESNKSRFDGSCVRNSVLIISHVTFPDCRRAHFFPTTFLEIAVFRSNRSWLLLILMTR